MGVGGTAPRPLSADSPAANTHSHMENNLVIVREIHKSWSSSSLQLHSSYGKFRRTFYGKWLIFLDIPAVIRLTTMPRSASQDLSRKRKMGLHSLVIINQPNLSGRTLVPTITTFLSNFRYICTSTYNEKWFCYLRMFPPHFKRNRRYIRLIRTIFLSSLVI